MTARVATFVRQRLALLWILRWADWRSVAIYGVLVTAFWQMPGVAAIAVGDVVKSIAAEAGRGGGELSAVAWPLAVVGVLLALDQVLQSMLEPAQLWLVTRINSAVETALRQTVSAPPGIDHLEDQQIRDLAALPVHDQGLLSIGAGAAGQLALIGRLAGVFTAAMVVAPRSLPAAFVVVAAMMASRTVLLRYYVKHMAEMFTRRVPEQRAADYWKEVAGSPLGGREVRLFGFAPWALQKFGESADIVRRLWRDLILGAFPVHWKTGALNVIGALVPLVILARAGATGALAPSDLVAALGGVIAVHRILANATLDCHSIAAATRQIDALRELEQQHQVEVAQRPASSPRPRNADDQVPTITFEGVSFRYPGSTTEVLRGLDLELRPGESVAVVGENGAGKTTLLKLLAGFYRPTEGRILIDGEDLQAIDIAAWRSQLAVIFQDFVRYELPLLDNVALADLDRNGAVVEAERALEAAGGREVLDSLPFGWDTVLSRQFRRGAELSGGQWQRVALARALYAAQTGGKVLILDEPTASLDPSAEVALFDQLLTHAAGCTAVVVSHRFSTVRRAQRIVVLSDGAISEDGDHASLVARGGTYAHLYSLQASRFVSAADGTDGRRS